ncbi:hypothetical protein KAR91_57285 [Candidatus Pacearchaeota archaeon]|nr:hypothetical protein [Candidatus Pacearchaeota archaeon]
MKTIKEIIGFVIFATVFFCIGYGACISTFTDGKMELIVIMEDVKDGSTGTMPKYFYTVGDLPIGYVDGIETGTFKLYQRALGVKEDGKPGWEETAQQTMFFNASE